DSSRSEEAEMPSGEVLVPSLHDGLYQCQYVGCQRLEGFALKCELKKHTRIHTRPFKCKCSDCPYAAAEKKDVDRHIKVAHKKLAGKLWGPMEPFVCTVCGKKFTREDNVQKHYKVQHIK
ncbi:unnamed protein product, partial [Penicillium salamii]